MRTCFKVAIILAITIIGVLADRIFAVGDYLLLLRGWSYLGMMSVFLFSWWLWKSLRLGFASVFLFAIFQDIGLSLIYGAGWGALFKTPEWTGKIYGTPFILFDNSLLGIPVGYILFGYLAVILILWKVMRNGK